MEEAIGHVSRSVHDVLIDPHAGISNVTEWAKKQACWSRIQNLEVEWPDVFIEELITLEENRTEKRAARKDQRMLNGIEAQSMVVNAGATFWKNALQWGKEYSILSAKEAGVLSVASLIPKKLPSEKQAALALQTYERLKSEGFSEKISP